MELLHDLLSFSDEEKGNIVIRTKDENVSKLELGNRVSKTRAFLKQFNLSKGDRVLIQLPNCIETIQLLFALSKMGVIAVIIDTAVSNSNLEYIINDCKPKLFMTNRVDKPNNFGFSISKDIYNSYLKDTFGRTETDWSTNHIISENDIALLIYTSGSTGYPKAVISTHRQITFCVKTISESLGIKNKDVIGNFLPFSFDYGLYQIFLALYCSATICVGDSSDAGIQLYRYLHRWEVTIFPSMPHLTKGMLKLSKRYKKALKIRMITNTGERFPNYLINDIKVLMPKCEVFLMYGLTECKRVSILYPNEINYKIDSVGQPLESTKCYVVDENNNILGPNQVGELIVIGPHLMDGYWNSKELTNDRYRKVRALGCTALFTGDLFRIDEKGYLYFEGRVDGLYKQRGYRISSLEIERVVENFEGIEKVALIPPDKEVGSSFLFIEGAAEISILKDYLRTNIEEYKIPTKVIKVGKMPINVNGKIDKVRLKLNRESHL